MPQKTEIETAEDIRTAVTSPAAGEHSASPRAAEAPPAPSRRPIPFWMIIGAIAVVAAVGLGIWNYYSKFENTDDAQVDGHINPISSRVSGYIVKVNIDDNQYVDAGTVLAEIDPKDYQVAVDKAKADLAAAEATAIAAGHNVPITTVDTSSQLDTAHADVTNAQAGIIAAQQQFDAARATLAQNEANDVKAQNDLVRYQQLVSKQEVSQQQYDQAVAAAKASTAAVAASRADVSAAEAQVRQAQSKLIQAQASVRSAELAPREVAVSEAQRSSADAQVAQKKAALEQALLNLQYCTIVAPVAGVVNKNVEVGMNVQPGQQLLSLVPLDDVWVTANFKETQLRYMRPGQPVEISVDAFSHKYEGHVDSIAGASGSRFSLLPPENATGNYVRSFSGYPSRLCWNPAPIKTIYCGPECPLSQVCELSERKRHNLQSGPSDLASSGKSLDYRADGDARDVHGSSGHEHRERRSAAYCGQPFCRAGRKHLGTHFVSRFECDRTAAERMGVFGDRSKALLHVLRPAVHDELVHVRTRAESRRAHHLPDSPGRRRRWSAAERAGYPR